MVQEEHKGAESTGAHDGKGPAHHRREIAVARLVLLPLDTVIAGLGHRRLPGAGGCPVRQLTLALFSNTF